MREGPIARAELRSDAEPEFQTYRGMQTAVFVAGSAEGVNAVADDPKLLRRLTEIAAPPSTTLFLAMTAGVTTVSSSGANGLIYRVRITVSC